MDTIPQIKRHKLKDYVKRIQDFAAYRKYTLETKTEYLRVKGWRKILSKCSQETSWSSLSNIEQH